MLRSAFPKPRLQQFRLYSGKPSLYTDDAPDSPPIKLATGAELEFLGTSSACSTSTRNVSSLVFHYPGGSWMFDCGEGTVRQLMNSSVRASKIDSVFITHLHGDHFYGLPGLGMRLIGLRDEQEATKVFVPFGIRSFLGTSVSANRHFKIHEIVPSRSRRAQKQSINPVTLDPETNSYALTSNELFSITAVPIKHTIFCLGYIIQEHEQRGKIDAARLTNEFGLPPGPIYKELIAGKSITAPDGRIIEPSLVIGTPRRARKIVILGDTCDPSALAEHAMDADVLVHEATCSNEDYAVAVSKGHSTAGMAGAFARRIRAKHLILNHFSPRGVRVTEYEESKAVRILVSQAREAFGSEFVYAARDFWRFPVPF